MAAMYASVLKSQPNPVSVQLQNILVSLERSAALTTIAEATRNAAAMSAPIQSTKVTSQLVNAVSQTNALCLRNAWLKSPFLDKRSSLLNASTDPYAVEYGLSFSTSREVFNFGEV